MTKQVQRRRGTATQHTSFTGAEGEISVNTTNKTVHVHDGVTTGGIEAARADLDNVSAASVLSAAGITATAAELNYVDGVTSAIQTQINAKAPIASPTFTGTVTVPTADINGGTIDGTVIGGATPAAGSFTQANFADNAKAVFGAGSDLEIYHDGAHSRLKETGTGDFYFDVSNSLFIRRNDTSALMASFEAGTAKLYYDNAPKLSTTSTGVDVTGTVTADGLVVDGNINLPQVTPYINAVANLVVDIDSDNNNTGASFLLTHDGATKNILKAEENGDISFYEDTGTTPKFYWDASAESLGIGTATPSVTLNTVSDTVWFQNAARTYGIGIYADDANTATKIRQINSGGDIKLVTGSGGVNEFVFDASGNVGIGVVPKTGGSSWQHIQFGGTGNIIARPSDTILDAMFANNYYINASNVDSYITTGAAARMFLNDSAISFDQAASGAADSAISWSTAMAIDSSGNVGIGEQDPSGYWSQASQLVIQGGNSGITVSSSSVGNGRLVFTDTKSTTAGLNDGGMIAYGHSGDAMAFQTAGTERMRIDSSGNVLVNKTSISYNAVGVELLAVGKGQFTRIGGELLTLNRQGNDGSLVDFRQDGALVGSIGVVGDELYIGSTGGTDAAIRMGFSTIAPADTSGGNRDQTINLGAANNRFKDLYLSGGVYLGGTGAANKLDDYEEGTWTPTVASGSASVTRGSYIKIGDQVTLSLTVGAFTDTTSATIITITNIPFQSRLNDAYQSHGAVMFQHVDAGTNSLTAYINDGFNTLEFFENSSTGSWVAQKHSDILDVNGYIRTTISYTAA